MSVSMKGLTSYILNLERKFWSESFLVKWAVVYVVTMRRSWALSLSGRLATDGGILTIELQC